jgi:hypothetical protein
MIGRRHRRSGGNAPVAALSPGLQPACTATDLKPQLLPIIFERRRENKEHTL